MFFPSKKKRLWRACVTQYAGLNAATDATCSQLQQQPRHQHQHHPPPPHLYLQTSSTKDQQRSPLPRLNCFARCCCNTNLESCSSGSSSTNNHCPLPPLPPPPHAYLNCCCFESQGLCQKMIVDSEIERQTDSESDNAMVISEQETNNTNTSGCYYENCCDNSPGDVYELQLEKNSTVTATVRPTTTKMCHRQIQQQCQTRRDENISGIATPLTTTTPPSPVGMTVASAVAATAASVFRNCCGGGCLSTASTDSNTSDGGRLSHNHSPNMITSFSGQTDNNIQTTALVIVRNLNKNSSSNNNIYNVSEPSTAPRANDLSNGIFPSSSFPISSALCSCPSAYIPSQVNDPKDVFAALMKKLKDHQRATLLEAVEKRFTCTNDGRQPDCILVQRGPIMGEEPNFIACRLWFWADLNDSTQLKRIPTCPNGKDRVYVCCNPTHWSRVLLPESAPPPYQRCIMDRLKPEDRNTSDALKNFGNSGNTTASSTVSSSSNTTITGSICNSFEQQGLRVKIPDSFTTEGEDHLTAPWCQVLYWELAQRVGDRYLAKHSSINVYSEGPGWSMAGNSDVPNSNETRYGEICLKELADKRKSASPEIVQKIRRKIGLGITLSQEADGVWLYNRSAAPVFVSSPTLNDYDWWFHVSKVPPGYCLKAFDIHRVRTQPQQIANAQQQGPIDKFCMRISFVKGWGPKYCRREIFTCPCWLEVIFTRR